MFDGNYLLPNKIIKGSLINSQRGFSLLEMAIVLVVVGLLLGGSLIPLSMQMEKKDRDTTKRQLDDIREALIGFALVNRQLPCPDIDNDGVMDGATTCSNVEGGLPWVNLGLGKQDAWGQPFTYSVTSDFANAAAFFSLSTAGDIAVYDESGGAVAEFIPAIVISHGKNWATTSSTDEAENTDGDSTFIDRAYSVNAVSTFDDLMIWVPPNVLKSKMVSAALLP